MPRTRRFHVGMVAPGRVRSLEEAAAWLDRIEALADALSAASDLGLVAPGLLLLDVAYITGGIAGYVREQAPAAWTSDVGENGDALADFVVRVARSAAVVPGEITGKYENAVAALAADLPEAWRARDRR